MSMAWMAAALVAGAAPQAEAPAIAHQELVAGQSQAAITITGARESGRADPARLINLGVAHARNGDTERARELFRKAYFAREWVELETATGAWVDSRELALRALAMLERGQLSRAGLLARN